MPPVKSARRTRRIYPICFSPKYKTVSGRKSLISAGKPEFPVPGRLPERFFALQILFPAGFARFFSESLNKKQKRGFLLAFALRACISVLAVITIVVDGAPTGCRWLNILSNYLGFGLTPAVALCLVYVLDKKSIIRRGFKAAVCCEGAYLLFLAATLPYGLVFSVSRENLYARGEYFYLYVAMYYAAML